MKEPFIFMPLLILGPKAPSNEIDGKSERQSPPKELSGAEVLEQFEAIGNMKFEKTSGTRKWQHTEAELN